MPVQDSVTLSKSKLKRGLQCAKSLYFSLYQKHLEPKPDLALQMQFDEGHEVGALARKRFGPGYLIDLKPWDFSGFVQATRAAIERGEEVIFEAAVVTGNLFARTDVLRKVKGTEKWDIIEVKKSTDVKVDHLQDIVIQYLISEKAGLSINKLYVMHINRDCVHPHLENLFTMRDVTIEAMELATEMKNKLNGLWKLAKNSAEPTVDIGPHCEVPHKCVFRDHCWKKIPDMSVFNIYKIGGKKWEYYQKGILDISEVNPEEFVGNTRRMIECTQTNSRFVDQEGVRKDLEAFQFPLYFLDFETAMFAIPRYPGTRPYQQIPFQYSLHVWPQKDSDSTNHFEFLHRQDSDPGPDLLKDLVSQLGTEGSIVAYNKKFESSCLTQLGERFPEYAETIKAINARLVDPLPIFQNHIYDPKFHGTFSIKTVAPALLGADASYEDMTIGDGAMAQVTLRNLITKNLGNNEEQIVEALLKYCHKDSWLMVELVRWLYAAISPYGSSH